MFGHDARVPVYPLVISPPLAARSVLPVVAVGLGAAFVGCGFVVESVASRIGFFVAAVICGAFAIRLWRLAVVLRRDDALVRGVLVTRVVPRRNGLSWTEAAYFDWVDDQGIGHRVHAVVLSFCYAFSNPRRFKEPLERANAAIDSWVDEQEGPY